MLEIVNVCELKTLRKEGTLVSSKHSVIFYLIFRHIKVQTQNCHIDFFQRFPSSSVGLEASRNPMDYLINVESDGTVNWNFPRTVETSCKLDVYRFPFDRQYCSLVFGSWAFDGSLVDVRNSSAAGDTKNFVDNGEWSLVQITAERHVLYYECCEQPFPDVTFTLVLERQAMYYLFNIIFPYLLITLLHLTSFLLPAVSGEKISLNVSILLGLTVFLLLVAEIMPPQSEVIPAIGKLCGTGSHDRQIYGTVADARNTDDIFR